MDKIGRSFNSRLPHTLMWAIIVLSLIALILAAVGLVRDIANPDVKVWMGDEIFYAKLASSDPVRQRGLAGVEKIGDNQAMLFVFDDDAEWGIWMKGMKVPIDIIWLDSDKQVVHIERKVQPDAEPYETYSPGAPARYVIETAAGASSRAKLEVGDKVKFDLEGR